MRKLIATLSVLALVVAIVPVSANASDMARRHHRYVSHPAPVYQAAFVPFRPDPVGFMLGGAAIGALIGAAVCPPCAIAGSVLTSGGGALLGGGIGAVSGGVLSVAVTPQRYQFNAN